MKTLIICLFIGLASANNNVLDDAVFDLLAAVADPGWGAAPKAVVSVPAPGPVAVPVPAHPKPVWNAPKPVWTAPQPAWNPPKAAWNPPKPAWNPPKPAWNPPKPSWSPNVPQQALVKIKSVIHTQAQALAEAPALQAAIENALNVQQTYAKKVSWAASKVQSLQESQLAHQQQALDQARAVLHALANSPSWPAKGHAWSA